MTTIEEQRDRFREIRAEVQSLSSICNQEFLVRCLATRIGDNIRAWPIGDESSLDEKKKADSWVFAARQVLADVLRELVEVEVVSRDLFSTTVQCTGPAEAVEIWRRGYFREFHPAGYGTSVSDKQSNSDGTIAILVWKANSCD